MFNTKKYFKYEVSGWIMSSLNMYIFKVPGELDAKFLSKHRPNQNMSTWSSSLQLGDDWLQGA